MYIHYIYILHTCTCLSICIETIDRYNDTIISGAGDGSNPTSPVNSIAGVTPSTPHSKNPKSSGKYNYVNLSKLILSFNNSSFGHFVNEVNKIWYLRRLIYQISLTSCTTWRNGK